MKLYFSIEGILPVSFIYSFLMSFFFLYYFSKVKENWKSSIIFFIATLHLSMVFVLPVIIFMFLAPEGMSKDIYFEKDVEKTILAIKTLTMTNHALNKFVYPFSIVYYESGFQSFKYKICPSTCKSLVNWVKNLWVIPAIILLGFALLFKKDEILGYYDDVLVYYINYLNIYDLICMYFEFGFSAMDTVRYCSRTCCKKGTYKLYIQGKLMYHKRKLYKEFEKEFNELKLITNTYAEDIQKFKLTQVFTFVSKHELLIQKGYYSEQKPNDSPKPPLQNPTQFQMEKIISSPFAKVKSLGRKITRINNIENREIKGIGKEKCCYKICSNFVVEVIKITLFSFVCLLIFLLDFEYYQLYGDDFFGNKNETNSTNLTLHLMNNNTNNTANTTNPDFEKFGLAKQIFSFFIGYPILFPLFAITTGLYLTPILYSVVKKQFITGEYIYGRGFSNNLEIISSVRKITSSVAASMYLGALFTIHVIIKEKPTEEKYKEFFQFYDIPYTDAVFALKFVFLICVMAISNLEYINFGCYELPISDEGNFYLNSCIFGILEGRKKHYLQIAQQQNLNQQAYTNIEMYTLY